MTRGKKSRCGTSVGDGNWPHLRERRAQDRANLFIWCKSHRKCSSHGRLVMGNENFPGTHPGGCIQNDNSAVVKKKTNLFKGRAATQDYPHHRLICRLFSQWICNTQHETQRLFVYDHKWQRKAAILYIWEAFVLYGFKMPCGKYN